jgi:hypothetical protein
MANTQPKIDDIVFLYGGLYIVLMIVSPNSLKLKNISSGKFAFAYNYDITMATPSDIVKWRLCN